MRKYALEISVTLFIFILVMSLLLIMKNPYGCEKNDIKCLIERGIAHKDIFICSHASGYSKDCCFKELAVKLKKPMFCDYISLDKGNCTKKQCIEMAGV